MEFWGIEIKPGSPVKVEPEDGYLIHVSQVSLGESVKVKEDESIPVYVEVGDDDDNDKQKLVIGNLSQKIPQVSLDLFFEREFELSHNCKTSSVFLLGYKSPDVADEQDEELDSDFDSEEEGIPMDFFKNGTEKSNPNGQKAKIEAIESDSDEDEDEDDESDGEEEEDEAPLKVEAPSKKRANGGEMNKAVASKKANQQQKPSGGKKSGKSGCQFPCGASCKK